MGPVTLALGVLLALILFPPVSATVAIFALSFGDGLSSLMGRLYGHNLPRLLKNKTVIGSMSCFIAVFISTWAVTGHFFTALLIALIITIIEALPLGNFDNIAIPVVAGINCYLLGF
jgi:phytol kinase